MTPTIRLNPKTINEVYLPHLQDQHRYQIYYGGSSSGKSVFLATRAVLDVLQGRNYLVVRKVQRTIAKSCWNEIQKAIIRLKLLPYFSINKSDLTITAKNNGAQILFAGLDDVEKVKSITPKNGVLTDIWIEEATETEYEDYKQLLKRIRGRTEHAKRLTMSFNPVNELHWIYKEFFEGLWIDGRNQIENGPLMIQKTTYKDNRFLTDDDRQMMEEESDPYFYEVYTLGNWGVLGGVLFKEPPKHTNDRTLLRDGICHIDAAYGGGDYTAFTCGKRVGDTIYIYGRLWPKHVDTVLDTIITESQQMLCGPIYCETNGDKGYLGREIRRRDYEPRMYAEKMNKYLKISTFLRKWWTSIVFIDGTDPEYINQIRYYTDDAEHDDAPDSCACVCRILDRRE